MKMMADVTQRKLTKRLIIYCSFRFVKNIYLKKPLRACVPWNTQNTGSYATSNADLYAHVSGKLTLKSITFSMSFKCYSLVILTKRQIAHEKLSQDQFYLKITYTCVYPCRSVRDYFKTEFLLVTEGGIRQYLRGIVFGFSVLFILQRAVHGMGRENYQTSIFYHV